MSPLPDSSRGGIIRRAFQVALAVAIGMGALVVRARSQGSERAANQKLLDRKVSAAVRSAPSDLVQAFESTLLSARVSGGVAVTQGCETSQEKPIHVRGATVREVLESMVRADVHYRWTIQDGVVNMMPTEGLPPLLKVKIKSLEVKDPHNMDYASSKLFSLPEVRQAAARLGLMQGGVQSFLSSMGGTKPAGPEPIAPASLHLQDVTVLEALNAIVCANGTAVWVFSERYCHGSGTFNVSFSR